MQLSLRVPYDVKAVQIGYETLDGAPFTPPYGDIHHRTQTLRGISDPTVAVDWMPRPSLMLGAGLSLPVGEIVPNPIELGREGLTHEHIQFGSGTFRPTLARPASIASCTRKGSTTKRSSGRERRGACRCPARSDALR